MTADDPKQPVDGKQYWAIISTSVPHGRSERIMIKNSIGILQSRKVVGFLWLLAGVLMMIPSVLSDGHETSVGVGVMFLIFGIVSLSRGQKS